MPVRVGFIGTGLVAQLHLANLARMEDVEIAALCDISPEALARTQRLYGGRTYADHREMLERERLDCVYLCLPPFAHTGQEFDVIERGIPLFVEKPVALDLAYGRRVARAIEERGLLATVGYHWRYYDTVDRVRALLEARTVGLVLGTWLGGIWRAPWWIDKARSGGQLVEQVTHLFDLARYLVGEIVAVSGLGYRGLVTDVPGYTLDDATTVNLRFASGAIGTISATSALGRGGRVGLHLIGRNLSIEITATLLRIGDAEKVVEYAPQTPPMEREDAAWIQAVRTGDPRGLRSTYRDGLRTLAATLAATRSLEQDGVWLTPEEV